MAPVATNDPTQEIQERKLHSSKSHVNLRFQDPSKFLSIVEGDNDDYEHKRFKPVWPEVDWEPLDDVEVTERGLSADPEKKSLFAAAKKVRYLTPVIGVELEGIDLRQLSDSQKDELALLIAENGVAFFRDQPLDIHEQLNLGRHFGPLHKHASNEVPKESGLEEVNVVYADSTAARPDFGSFSKLELWHSDVTYERQPPSTTSLKGYTIPDVGGDTLWSSGYALYSSLSPGLQKYLEGLSALHSAVAQAESARASGKYVRRTEIESIHPVVRVHPATGWKSIFVNAGFTRRIIGIPKAESDTILNFLFRQIVENPDFQVRLKWENNTVAIWDNRIVTHSAIFDFWPAKRHALRVTPHGEMPMSVAEYEQKTGNVAKDRQIEICKSQWIDLTATVKNNRSAPKVYSD